MKECTIFYKGGKTVCTADVDGDPSRVPKEGVLAVVTPSENGQRIRWMRPYYLWYEEYGEFYETTPDTLWRKLALPGWHIVLFGEYVSDEEMNDVLVKAARIYKGQKTWQNVEKPENNAWR